MNTHNTQPAVPRWQAKQLQFLSTDFERNVMVDFETTALDAGNNPLTHEQVEKITFNRFTHKALMAQGYFLSKITGPNNYVALAVHRTPYSGAIIMLEFNTDLLQVDVQTEQAQPNTAYNKYNIGDVAYYLGTNIQMVIGSVKFSNKHWMYQSNTGGPFVEEINLQPQPQSQINAAAELANQTVNPAPNSIDASKGEPLPEWVEPTDTLTPNTLNLTPSNPANP